MATIEDLRSSTPAPLRVVKRPSALSLVATKFQKSSEDETKSDESIKSAASCNAERPLTIRKRAQNGVVPAVRQAPAFKRLLRPERSYVKLPGQQPRQETRIKSNGIITAMPTDLPADHEYSEQRLAPRLFDVHADTAELHKDLFQLTDDYSGSIRSARFPPLDYGCTRLMALRPEPAVLIPVIAITPEVQTLGEGSGSFWAAVEVSGQIRRSNGSTDADAFETRGSQLKTQRDHFPFGCLLDLQIDVLPKGGVQITEILQEEPPPSSLDGSSTILILVRLQLAQKKADQTRNASFSTISDELIEDLEQHLGTSTLEYLHVRLRYSHPAFSSLTSVDTSRSLPSQSTGLSELQTRLETNAIARIGQNRNASQWSPRQPSPAPNPLFRIVATHWDPQRAADAVHQILSPRSLGITQLEPEPERVLRPRDSSHCTYCSSECSSCPAQWRSKVDSWNQGVSDQGIREKLKKAEERSTPKFSVPQRRTSLKKDITVREPEKAWVPSSNSTPKTLVGIQTTGTPSSTSSVIRRTQKSRSTPKVSDASQYRTLDATSGESGGRPRTNLTLKENRTPKSRRSPSIVNKQNYLGSLEEFGARPRAAKASTFRKPSVGSKIVGRWAWASWW